jgi:hypothetical protein
MKIEMKVTTFELSGSKFVEVSEKMKFIDEIELSMLIESCKFFRKLGGTETVNRNYTCRGYMPVKLTSKSPDKATKVVREFIYE